MDYLETQLTKEKLHMMNYMNALKILKTPFQKFFQSESLNPYNSGYDAHEAKEDFKQCTQMEAQSFKDLIIQNMDSIEKCIVERTLHDRKTEIRLNERKLQIQECKVTMIKALDANLVVTEIRNECSIKENENIVSGNGNNKSRNDMEAGKADIRPIYDTDSLEQVHNDDYNVFAMENEHPEQPEFMNNTYLVEQGDSNITLDSSDMSNDGEEAD
ncbi:hypothetical protein Tco_1570399 [Tanacetum coccineum]